jgi:hypothetical protein
VPRPEDLNVPTSVLVLLVLGLLSFFVTIALSQLAWVQASMNLMRVEVGSLVEAAENADTDFQAAHLLRDLLRVDSIRLDALGRANGLRTKQLLFAGLAQMFAVGFLVSASGILVIAART